MTGSDDSDKENAGGERSQLKPRTDVNRSQVLKRKFFALKASGDVPKHVVELFDNPGGSGYDRSKQSEIINNAFEKVGKKWVVNWDKPLFKEAKSRPADMDTSGNPSCLIVSLYGL